MSSSVPPSPTGGDPWDEALGPLLTSLSESLAAEGIGITGPPLADQLTRPGGGEADLAFPVHRHAKSLGRDPSAVAAAIASRIRPTEQIERIDAARGFVNFHARPAWLAEATLGRALATGRPYGHAPTSSSSVCVEHTSANPTGPFHMGRVRNGIIGDTVARVLRSTGHRVTTQYYVDDVGRQAAMITWIWMQPPASWPPEIRAAAPDADGPRTDGPRPDLDLGRPYPAVSAYLKTHPEAAEQVAELARRLESGEAPPEHRALAEAILRGMTGSLERIGIRFDEFVWESRFVQDRSVDEVVARLSKAPNATVEPNGAQAIDARPYHLPTESERIIFARGNGTTLYVTRDTAYHLEKFRRFDRVVDVLGQDHLLHAETLKALLTELGETRRPEFLIYQDLTVPEGGRMSTRKGSAVYLDDLLDEAVVRARAEVERRRSDLPAPELDRISRAVASGAVRYHVLRVAPEKTVTFRWEDAMAFEGRSGPFVQYAHARACSILRKAENESGPWPFDAPAVADPDSMALVRVLSQLPRTLAYAARSGHVHAVAGLAHEVADAFNRFYEKVPVLNAPPELRRSRIALVAATRASVRVLLDLVGVEPLETM